MFDIFVDMNELSNILRLKYFYSVYKFNYLIVYLSNNFIKILYVHRKANKFNPIPGGGEEFAPPAGISHQAES